MFLKAVFAFLFLCVFGSKKLVERRVIGETLKLLLKQQTKHDKNANPPFVWAEQKGLFSSGVHFNALSREIVEDAAATLIRRKFSIVKEKPDFFLFFFSYIVF